MPPKKKSKIKTPYEEAAENLTLVAKKTTKMTEKDKKELRAALRRLWRAT